MLVVLVVASVPSVGAEPVEATPDSVERTAATAEDVAATCTASDPDRQRACRRWATEEMPRWAGEDAPAELRAYGDQLVAWARREAARTTGWAEGSAANGTAWARDTADELRRDGEAQAGGLAGYVEGDLGPWADRTAEAWLDWVNDLIAYLQNDPGPEGGFPPDPSGPFLLYPELCMGGDCTDLPPLPDLDGPDLAPPPVQKPSLPGTPDRPALPALAPPPVPDPAPPGPPEPEGAGPGSGPGTGVAAEDAGVAAGQAPAARRSDDAAAAWSGDTKRAPSDPVLVHPADPVTIAVAGLAALLAGALAFLRLHRRLTRENVLGNEIRSRMVDLVREEPAVSPVDLADRLDVAVSTVTYHARVLEETGHLVIRRRKQRTRYFPPTRRTPAEEAALAALRKPARREILDLVHETPGLNLSEMARRLGKHRSTVKHHVDRLAEAGIVQEREGGRGRRFDLVPAAARTLGSSDPSP